MYFATCLGVKFEPDFLQQRNRSVCGQKYCCKNILIFAARISAFQAIFTFDICTEMHQCELEAAPKSGLDRNLFSQAHPPCPPSPIFLQLSLETSSPPSYSNIHPQHPPFPIRPTLATFYTPVSPTAK